MARDMNRIGSELLPAIAYGDAIGLPVEVMSAADIKQLYGHINGLEPPTKNRFYPGEYPAGTTSDDTELSVAVAQSLIRADGFDIADQAREHLQVFRRAPKRQRDDGSVSVRGWGRSTTEAMQRLDGGVAPELSGQLDGKGNGVVMKLAPLAYWQAVRGTTPDVRHAQYDALTTMTHNSDEARSCTRLHGDILYEIATRDMTLVELSQAALGLIANEPMADYKGRITRVFNEPVTTFDDLVERYALPDNNGHYGFRVPNTLAMAYDIFRVAKGDYKTAVKYAANLGGDADSIASITGAMAAMWSGGQFEKPNDYESVQEYEGLARLSQELASRALVLAA